MRHDKQYHPTSRQCHFPPYMREAACLIFHDKYKQIRRIDPLLLESPVIDKGTKGDTVINAAFEEFKAAYTQNDLLLGLPRGIKRKEFTRLVRAHWPAWRLTRHCPSVPHKKTVYLTDAEASELATLLAQPDIKDNSVNRFESLHEAARKDTRVAQLVAKSGVTHLSFLESWLMQRFVWLKHRPEDRAPRLCTDTLRKRRRCADIWAGRRPWLWVKRRRCFEKDKARVKQQKAPVNKKKRRRPDDSDSDSDKDDGEPVYFDPDWYGPFTFVVDATRMEVPVEELTAGTHVFVNTRHIYGPKLAEPPPSVNQTISLMVYSVIHKHLGLVVGPDIMLTGSKLKASASASTKSELFEQQGVETW